MKFLLEKIDETSIASGRVLPAATFLQSSAWANVKSAFGWKPLYFSLDGKLLLLLLKKLTGGFTLAYIPHAPEESYSSVLSELARELKKHLPKGAVFIRFDLPWEREVGKIETFPSLPNIFKKAEDIQPSTTVVLDLTMPEDKILSSMKSKTRYNIGLSSRKGICVSHYDAKYILGDGASFFDEWYEIYRETSVRDKIALHSKEYYKKVFEASINSSVDVRLYMAKDLQSEKGVDDLPVEGSINAKEEHLAGIITCFYEGKAVYLYGASRNLSREKMPAYGLQWQAICHAKAAGCTSYDFFGIPPADDPSHPMYGLYRFKTGFGGTIISRLGCLDYPLQPLLYNLYRTAETARNWYYRKFKKR